MTDQEKLALIQQTAKVVQDAMAANAVAALPDALKLLAMLEAEFMPPIAAPALDANDRAVIDSEIDSELAKK